jgi:hypothetical protein
MRQSEGNRAVLQDSIENLQADTDNWRIGPYMGGKRCTRWSEVRNMNDQEHLSSKKALMAAAAQRIADKQQAVINEFENAVSDKIANSPIENVTTVGDFLAEDD